MNAALRRRIVRAMRRQQGIDDEHEPPRAHAEIARLASQKMFNGWEFLSTLARYTEGRRQR